MGLPKPNLDDKRFFQIVEEARALIPSRAPEWTDHNFHDPGITFIDLFAWLAEIQQYRLNHVSNESYRRFFSFIGLTPRPRQPAEIVVSFDPLEKRRFVPAGTRVNPTLTNDLPFETIEDFSLTPVRLLEGERPEQKSSLVSLVTRSKDHEIQQEVAQANPAGHYEPFGPAPKIGDSLTLRLTRWFNDEPEIRLSVFLFEDDLPRPVPLPRNAPGFVQSVTLLWEVFTKSGWVELKVRSDGTLGFSRTGEIIFAGTDEVGKMDEFYQIRATLTAGHYEIPPRITAIRTNSIRARQVETIRNEEIAPGRGIPDQSVRLKKAPVLLSAEVDNGPFEWGEVLDWDQLIVALANAESPLVSQVRKSLGPQAEQHLGNVNATRALLKNVGESSKGNQIVDDMGQAFRQLLDNQGFLGEKGTAPSLCQSLPDVRRRNREALQRLFPDLFLSDRLEVQTGPPLGAPGRAEARSWVSWVQVADFCRSGPADRHYVLDPEKGVIRFGNGLNGMVPQATEMIRARFYRHTREAAGNVSPGLTWTMTLPAAAASVALTERLVSGTNIAAASGGSPPESLEDAQFRSRQIFRTPQRVVTAKDYESQALRTPGLRVARARAIPNLNPDLPTTMSPGDLTVVVVPATLPGAIRPGGTPPSPSQGFLKTVENFLNSRRLVATRIHVVPPDWVQLDVSARVVLKKGMPAVDIRKRLETKLTAFLNPIEGGPGPGQGWPFGREVFPSEIYRLLASDDGVEFATEVSLGARRLSQSGALDQTRLRSEDIKDETALAAKLKWPGDPLTTYITGRLSPETRAGLAAWAGNTKPPLALRRKLLRDLNRILEGGSIWDEDRFSGVRLRGKTREALRSALAGPGTALANHLLLQDTFPSELSRSARVPTTGLPYPGTYNLVTLPYELRNEANAPRMRRARSPGEMR